MNTNLPNFETYGNYSSSNYGAHALKFTIPGFAEVWFSYQTPVAFRMHRGNLFVRVNDWSTTTGKHLNAIDGGNKKARIAGDKFEAMLAQQVGGCVFGKAA